MKLTRKEKEVVQELLKGKRNQEIAENLNVSVNTIRTHLAHIYAKTNSSGRTDMILKSINIKNENQL